MTRLRIATYNVHKCVGIDRRFSPERIIHVLREIDADVVALQEVVCRPSSERRHNQSEFIAAELGVAACLGENRRHEGGAYGNVTLSQKPIESFVNIDISVRRYEPRGCLKASISVASGKTIDFFNLHLGTSFFERRLQTRRLTTEVFSEPADSRRVIVGDFNEWVNGLATRTFRSQFRSVEPKSHLGTARTFPGVLPMVHLDHIYFDHNIRLVSAFVHRSRTALIASDHLPIVADLEL